MPPAETIIHTTAGKIALLQSTGEGLPLLMLHGSGAAKEVFAEQFRSPLAAMHRMIAIDLPGHGASEDAADPETAYTLPGLAATVAEVLAALGIGRTAVYGWSLGGHVAIEMMASHPGLLAGVMITGVPPVGRGALGMLRGYHAHWDMLLASKEFLTPRDGERLARLCYGEYADPGLTAAVLRTDGRMRAVFTRSVMRGVGADQKRTVETSAVPLAVANGADDPIIRLSYVTGLAYANLWDGRCAIIPHSGHAPFMQAPNAFNALLHRFMTDMALREGMNGRAVAAEALGRSSGARVA